MFIAIRNVNLHKCPSKCVKLKFTKHITPHNIFGPLGISIGLATRGLHALFDLIGFKGHKLGCGNNFIGENHITYQMKGNILLCMIIVNSGWFVHDFFGTASCKPMPMKQISPVSHKTN